MLRNIHSQTDHVKHVKWHFTSYLYFNMFKQDMLFPMKRSCASINYLHNQDKYEYEFNILGNNLQVAITIVIEK
jgi:hypothetical protein